MNPGERIEKLPDILGISKEEFLETLGITDQAIRNMKDRGTGPRFDTATKIFSKFKQVNHLWLFLGEGEPLLPVDAVGEQSYYYGIPPVLQLSFLYQSVRENKHFQCVQQ